MKAIVVVMFIMGLAAVGFWYVTESERAYKELAYQRQQQEKETRRSEERLRKQREEDERIRKERADALAKEDATRLFLRYLDREESHLKQIAEESKIKMEKVSVDQESLSQELAALEEAEARKAAAAMQRKSNRRDKVERIDAILSSPTLNRLAFTYCGEDLSAMLTKFRSHIGSLIKISDEKTRRYKRNRETYHQSIKDADQKVDRLTEDATRQLREARARLGANVDVLREKVEGYRRTIQKLEEKELKTTLNLSEKKTLKASQEQLTIAEALLTSAEATAGLGSANKAHLDVTVAETAARRAVDTALSIRQDEDNAVEAEMNREADIFNAAALYENRSLDRVRAAMIACYNRASDQHADATRKLKLLQDAAVNIDFLNANEIEEMRKKVARSINNGVTKGL